MHGHGHHHHHHSSTHNIGVALALNAAFTVVEIVGGILTGSIAILADALHDFGDTLSLGLAYYFERLAEKDPDHRFSYGYRRFSLLSAVFTASFLVCGSLIVIYHAVPRLWMPVQPNATGMLLLAILGVLVNGFAALRVAGGTKMNEKMLSWHFIEDVLGWVSVLVVSIVMMFADLPILDPILSLVFTGMILFGVVRALRKTVRLFLQAVPEDLPHDRLVQSIRGLENILGVHDIHLWSLDGENHVLTLHIVVPEHLDLSAVSKVKADLRRRVSEFGKFHTTIEVETQAHDCPDADCTPT